MLILVLASQAVHYVCQVLEVSQGALVLLDEVHLYEWSLLNILIYELISTMNSFLGVNTDSINQIAVEVIVE
jgi:hypothetical protein